VLAEFTSPIKEKPVQQKYKTNIKGHGKVKELFVVIPIAATVLLSGLAKVDNCLENKLIQRSEIESDEDYKEYQDMRDAGLLDEEGYYIGESLPAAQVDVEQQGSIHISFADNRYLQINYYTDAGLTEQINTESCYLNPGDCIYGKVVETKNPNSNLYSLFEYRIFVYEDNQIKKEFYQNASDDGLVYQIPSNFDGVELSIIPIGEYSERNIALSTYSVDDDGNIHELTSVGMWSVNGEVCNGNIAKISPIESYILKYNFENEKENYFYVSCSPKCFTQDPQKTGYVEFWEAEATDEDMTYSVELHKYLTLSITTDKKATVQIGNDEAETIKKNKTWQSSALKYGDVITIETEGNCTILDGDYRHVQASKAPIANGYRYTLLIAESVSDNTKETLSQFLRADSDSSYILTLDTQSEHGECTYKLDGKKVSGNIVVKDGQTLKLKYKITDKNYEFASDQDGKFVQAFTKLTSSIIKPEKEIEIEITSELDGTTIHPDEYFQIVQKGDK
jgi:hypothetical protein